MNKIINKSICYALTGLILMVCNNAYAVWSHKKGEPKGSDVSYLVQNFSQSQWEQSNFAPLVNVEQFQDLRFGLMVSYGITTYDKTELSWGTIGRESRYIPDGDALADGHSLPSGEWASWDQKMKLEKFDAKQWVRFAQDAGFKYIVFLAKHHEGYHFWDTEFSDFKVTNSPFGRDFLKELIDACHEANMPIGIYYSQRDWYNPNYQPTGFGKDGLEPGPMHKKYLEYQENVVTELLTKYGKIDYFWWDAAWWGGMFEAYMWDAENLTRKVRKLQPHIVMNNRASVPGDFDTPEQRLGGFQRWRPWEAVISLEDTWSYSGPEHKDKKQVLSAIINSSINNGNLLLSMGPRWAGDFDPSQIKTMLEVGKWLKTFGESIYDTRGGPWQPYSWGGSTFKGSTAYIHATKIKNDKIVLDAIEGVSIRSASLLYNCGTSWWPFGNTQLDYTEQSGKIEIIIPAQCQDDIDTVIKLEMDKDLSNITPIKSSQLDQNVEESAELRPFDYELVYGKQLKSGVSITSNESSSPAKEIVMAQVVYGDSDSHTSIATQPLTNPTLNISFDQEKIVSGIILSGELKGKSLQLSISNDGINWQPIWQSVPEDNKDTWVIEVNDFKAGAQTPGKQILNMRLTMNSEVPEQLIINQINIWTKAHK